MGMKAERAGEGINLEDGKHSGTIARWEERGNPPSDKQPYHYFDAVVSTEDDDGEEIELKLGLSAKLGEKTDLGKFLSENGVDVEALLDNDDDDIEIERTLSGFIGRKVSFVTVHKKTPNGSFVNIVKESFRVE